MAKTRKKLENSIDKIEEETIETVETTETEETEEKTIETVVETTEVEEKETEEKTTETEEIAETIETTEVEEKEIIAEPIETKSYDDLYKEINFLKEENSKLKDKINQYENSVTYKFNKYDDVIYPSKFQNKRFTVFALEGLSNRGPLYKLFCKYDETFEDLVPESLLAEASSFTSK